MDMAFCVVAIVSHFYFFVERYVSPLFSASTEASDLVIIFILADNEMS